MPSTTTVWHLDHQEEYGFCAWLYTALYRPFLKHCTLTNRRWGLCDGPCPALLRGDWALYPLIVSRESFSHQTLTRFEMGRAQPAICWCSIKYFLYIIFIPYAVCVSIFITSLLGVAVGLFSFSKYSAIIITYWLTLVSIWGSIFINP